MASRSLYGCCCRLSLPSCVLRLLLLLLPPVACHAHPFVVSAPRLALVFISAALIALLQAHCRRLLLLPVPAAAAAAASSCCLPTAHLPLPAVVSFCCYQSAQLCLVFLCVVAHAARLPAPGLTLSAPPRLTCLNWRVHFHISTFSHFPFSHFALYYK